MEAVEVLLAILVVVSVTTDLVLTVILEVCCATVVELKTAVEREDEEKLVTNLEAVTVRFCYSGVNVVHGVEGI